MHPWFKVRAKRRQQGYVLPSQSPICHRKIPHRSGSFSESISPPYSSQEKINLSAVRSHLVSDHAGFGPSPGVDCTQIMHGNDICEPAMIFCNLIMGMPMLDRCAHCPSMRTELCIEVTSNHQEIPLWLRRYSSIQPFPHFVSASMQFWLGNPHIPRMLIKAEKVYCIIKSSCPHMQQSTINQCLMPNMLWLKTVVGKHTHDTCIFMRGVSTVNTRPISRAPFALMLPVRFLEKHCTDVCLLWECEPRKQFIEKTRT